MAFLAQAAEPSAGHKHRQADKGAFDGKVPPGDDVLVEVVALPEPILEIF